MTKEEREKYFKKNNGNIEIYVVHKNLKAKCEITPEFIDDINPESIKLFLTNMVDDIIRESYKSKQIRRWPR